MRFQTPQFIDIEDKIFGPFTFKQFIYMVGGLGLSYVAYRMFPIAIAILIILPTLALAALLTFHKVNKKPFVYIMEASIKFFFQNKLYIWKEIKRKPSDKEDISQSKKKTFDGVPRLTESRLADISWSLDVLDMDQKNK